MPFKIKSSETGVIEIDYYTVPVFAIDKILHSSFEIYSKDMPDLINALRKANFPIDFPRCPIHFIINGITFKCDLRFGHSGSCISLPDGEQKVATVMWNKKDGY